MRFAAQFADKYLIRRFILNARIDSVNNALKNIFALMEKNHVLIAGGD